MKLTDKEFTKIIKIFGAKALIDAHTELKVTLNSKQLDEAIRIKNEKEVR